MRPLRVLTRRDAVDEANVAPIAEAAFIYLSGGSPMHLRSVLKDSPVVGRARRGLAARRRARRLGSGAMVLCDPMVDPRGGALTLGLGLLEQLAVIPHHDTWSEDKAKRTLRIAPDGPSHRRHRRAHGADPRRRGHVERRRRRHRDRLPRRRTRPTCPRCPDRWTTASPDELIAQVCHELRAPLTPIKGYLHTLLRRDEELGPEERRQIYEVLLREEQRLEDLVGDLLRATTLDQDAGGHDRGASTGRRS